MKKYFALFFLFFTLLFVLGYGIQKQTQLKPDKYDVAVSLVLVDVMAVDKEDKAVQDLTLEDFEVYEDGKRININSLDFIDFQKLDLKIREGEQGQARTKRFFVLFDSINTIKRMLDRSKPQIIQELMDLIQSGGEIEVSQMSEDSGIQILQNFTSDREQIVQAVNEASGSIWVERAVDDLYIPKIFDKKEVSDRFETHLGEVMNQAAREMYQFNMRHRFEKSLTNLLSYMNKIKDYPGRKSVLLLSGGFPELSFEKFAPIEDLVEKNNDGLDSTIAHSDITAAKIMDPFKVLQEGNRRYEDDIFDNLIQFANSYNISFYTLDPDNYLRYVLPDIAFDNYENITEIAKIKQNELANLKDLALKTGGAALQGSNKFDNFQEYVNRDLKSYYELSYYPKRKKADGKYHKIQVKVTRPDVKIRFRKGYYDFTNEQEESLLFASSSYNPDLFKQIQFQARTVPFVSGKDKFKLWINMALPVQDLILGGDPYKEFKFLKANFWVDDQKGANALNAQLSIPISMSQTFREKFKQARFYGYNTCSEELKLNSEEYRVIFSLYDGETGRLGTFEQNFEVPSLSKDTGETIVSAVFGQLVKAPRLGKDFTISDNEGILQVDQYLFYPMGSNQFRSRKDVSLFLQIYLPEKDDLSNPEILLFQEKKEVTTIDSVVVKELWNAKANV
ncbi:MAG: VWA domain-containing protein [Candidatus Aminicenantes bacterium]|nr:VWA domain-containing protein [Candidatus Aminicenantes bacterium]